MFKGEGDSVESSLLSPNEIVSSYVSKFNLMSKEEWAPPSQMCLFCFLLFLACAVVW